MAKILMLENPFPIKPYTKGELVKLYRPITLYVFNKWLDAIKDELGPIIGRTLSVEQVRILIIRYGVPKQIVKEVA